MLLRLAPEAPLPTILFTLAFPTLPPDLAFPAAWAQQVNQLIKMNIDSPPNPHALDRSVWATTLLDQVDFDLVAASVTCLCIDGVRIEFPISPACRRMLLRVLADVTDSTSEAERERIADALPAPPIRAPPSTALTTPSHSRRTSLSTFSGPPPPPTSASPAPPAPTDAHHPHPHPHPPVPASPPGPPGAKSPGGSGSGGSSDHKRSRSLLSTLLAALLPSSSVPVPPRTQLPMKKLTASRHLRRRARSTLVDCFRAHVLPEVNAHLGAARRWTIHGSGYAVWACTSMLGRVEAMVQFELDQAGPASSSGSGSGSRTSKRDSARILDDYQQSPFEDPGNEDDSSAEVTSLRQHAEALRGCAHRLLMREHMIQNEEREALMMLEIRARRRAWSTNRSVRSLLCSHFRLTFRP